ncbi:MAG: hypothetical protein ACF8GE_09925 [Phycisphaerales bacterium JB043]
MRANPLYKALTALVVLCVLGSCTSRPKHSEPGPVFTMARLEGQVLDIQVRVLPQSIEFTNTTPRRFETPRVWLNRWYSTRIDSIEPGQRVVIPLRAFADEHGRSPQAGGFFSSREQEHIVSVELQHESRLEKLVIVTTER